MSTHDETMRSEGAESFSLCVSLLVSLTRVSHFCFLSSQNRRVLFPSSSSESSSSSCQYTRTLSFTITIFYWCLLGSHSPLESLPIDESSGNQEEEREEDGERGADQAAEEEEDEDDGEDGEPVDLTEFQAVVLPVSCGSVTGELYKERFTGR